MLLRPSNSALAPVTLFSHLGWQIKQHIRSERQGLVRQLGVLRNIFSVCKAAHSVLGQSRHPPAAWGDKASLVSVMSACHDTIMEVLSGNVENSVFLLGEFDELQRWVVWEPGSEGPGGAAARTLLTLIQGSKEVVKNVTEDQVEFFLEGASPNLYLQPLTSLARLPPKCFR